MKLPKTILGLYKKIQNDPNSVNNKDVSKELKIKFKKTFNISIQAFILESKKKLPFLFRDGYKIEQRRRV